MDDYLADYKRKWARAQLHFAQLRESIERFEQTAHEPVRGQLSPDKSERTFHMPLEAGNPEWAMLVGDFAYNSRASLDYLVTALIRSQGKEEHETSQFPIYGIEKIDWKDIEDWWEADKRGTIARNLDGAPPGTKAALKTLQPFYGVPSIDPRDHPLHCLAALSNRDKHRRLNLLVRRGEFSFVSSEGKPLYDGPAVHGLVPEALEGDEYTVRLGGQHDPAVDMYLMPSYAVLLDEPPDLLEPVVHTLTRINAFIDGRVLPAITPLMHP